MERDGTMSETDKLRALLDGRGVGWSTPAEFANRKMFGDMAERTTYWGDGDRYRVMENFDGLLAVTGLTAEQAVDATLGKLKAKSHPYGYEPDTGAFDATRCECGCVNDISATFCNDCGGEIEIDERAEKEIYKYNRNSVFAVKHDDGSLEFGGKRYMASTLGSGKLTAEFVEEVVARNCEWYEGGEIDAQAIADELNATLGREVTPMLVSDDLGHVLITLGGIKTWDVTEDAATLGRGECEMTLTDTNYYGFDIYRCSECGSEAARLTFKGVSVPPKFCDECGKAVKQNAER